MHFGAEREGGGEGVGGGLAVGEQQRRHVHHLGGAELCDQFGDRADDDAGLARGRLVDFRAVLRRGARSTPSSAALVFASGLARALMMLGSDDEARGVEAKVGGDHGGQRQLQRLQCRYRLRG